MAGSDYTRALYPLVFLDNWLMPNVPFSQRNVGPGKLVHGGIDSRMWMRNPDTWKPNWKYRDAWKRLRDYNLNSRPYDNLQLAQTLASNQSYYWHSGNLPNVNLLTALFSPVQPLVRIINALIETVQGDRSIGPRVNWLAKFIEPRAATTIQNQARRALVNSRLRRARELINRVARGFLARAQARPAVVQYAQAVRRQRRGAQNRGLFGRVRGFIEQVVGPD